MPRTIASSASHCLGALCSNVATAAFLLLASSAAHGQHYEILMGKGVEVCDAYTSSLNSFKPHDPMLCDRSVSPRLTDLKKPKWQRLDVDKNLELIVSIDKLLRPDDPRLQPELRVQSLRGAVELGGVKYQMTTVDIDNDGKTEPVLRFTACEEGNPRVGGSALVVLQENKKEVDLGKSRLIANDVTRLVPDALTNIAIAMRDVFLHKEKTYLDIWYFNFAELHVLLTENADTRAVCKLAFKAK